MKKLFDRSVKLFYEQDKIVNELKGMVNKACEVAEEYQDLEEIRSPTPDIEHLH